MIADEDITALIGALQENAQRLGFIWTLTPGTITTLSPLTVTIDSPDASTAVAIPVVSLLGALPVGSRVMVMAVPPAGQYVVGFLSPTPYLTMGTSKQSTGVSGTGTTTSAPYVAIPGGAGVTFTKLHDATNLEVYMSNTYFVSATGTGVQMAAQINGTNYDMHFQVPSLANTRIGNTGFRVISGIPAGTHAIAIMWSRASGAGVLNQNSGGDWNSLLVKEVAP